jgi:diguanylate cyclase (GGDEF)-like protein
MISSIDEFDFLEPAGEQTCANGRNRFMSALAADLNIALAGGEKLALLLVDIRQFLSINLSYGYAIGDEILLRIPRLLQTTIKKATTIERLGDNLFGLIIPALPTAALLPLAVDKIRQKLSEPLQIAQHQLPLDCHIAYAVYPDQSQDEESLLLAAERVMSDVKSRKFNDDAIPTLAQPQGRERWKLEQQLRSAVDNGEFELYYQPKVRLRDREPSSAEALIRWNSSEFGFVSPDDFIPIAEESSLINRITEWALKTAIRDRLEVAPVDQEFSVAVNLSASDLYDRSLVDGLDSILKIWGLQPEHLSLEITESVIMDNPTLALKNLEQARNLGIKVALDDFGTGYSSLAYFKTLPVDEIKIDKSFVLNMQSDADDAVLVEAIISLAHKFNITVVAEGVEDAQTLRQLCAFGCDYAQGYHFSRPLPRAKFVRWLKSYSSERFWTPTPGNTF